MNARSPTRDLPGAAAMVPFIGGLDGICHTTAAQREVWLGTRLGEEASLAYNESVVLDLRGTLDTIALTRALKTLVVRHQSLRSSFSADGAYMCVARPDDLFEVLSSDASTLAPPARAALLAELHRQAVHLPFDLDNGPPFRAVLCRLADSHHQLILSGHHIACDGWSWAVIVEELGRLHDLERQPDGAPLPAAASYTSYALLEALAAGHQDMEQHVDFWLRRFGGGDLPVLELPLDHARPPVRSFNSRRACRLLDPRLMSAFHAVASAAGASLFVGMFSAFAATLHRLTGQEDLVIGIPAAGQLLHDMPGLVGHCVNLLPLRISAAAACPFDALLRESHSLVMDAFEHQAVSYGALLEKLALPRDASRLPLVSVMFNLDADTQSRPGGFTGLEVSQSTLARAYENFELFLNITPTRQGLQLELQYNADLFDEASVLRWLDMYECLLQSVVQQPDQPLGRLDLLSAAARDDLRRLQPAPSVLEGRPLMHAGFVQHAARHPERVALRHAGRHCSYGELEVLSNRLARNLRRQGMGRGKLVGLCLERGFEMVGALLGILKSGATYVPLDPSFPAARLEQYAADAGLSLLLTDSRIAAAPRHWSADAPLRIFELDQHHAWRLEAAEALAPDPQDAQPEDSAYVIYTSGSTGRPKGVCVPHRAVANLLQSLQEEPRMRADDTVAAVTTLSFDIAVAELVLPLAAGAQVVIVDREVAMDGNRLAGLLQSENITVLQATPGTWRLLIDAFWHGRPGFRAWVGGESVPRALALEMLDRCSEVWNVYGPTETTVWSTVWKMQRGTIHSRGVAIGRPIANTAVWVLDAGLEPCAIGVPGEICIAGTGLALGYLDQPDLSAGRFITADVLGTPTRLYRTGDRGRWRNEGVLEHLGRFDFQLKVRGYRIEPGEIEARCCEAAGVARCVVLAREDCPGDQRLVAYVALTPGASIDMEPLRRHLRERLPAYMVPQHILVLDSLPQLPNGKIDRKALPAPAASAPQAAGRVVPRDEREAVVLKAMEEVLSLPGMDMRDDFFAMGGHSLLAARLATLLGRAFGLTVPMRTLFESPTAEQLGRSIQALQADSGHRQAPPLVRRPERSSAPLTPPQERIRFIEEMHPGRSVYNAPSAQRLLGPLDIGVFRATLNEIARRQPALRTRVGWAVEDGRTVQYIADHIDVQLPLIDLRLLHRDQRESELMNRLQAFADLPMDIHRAPLFHAAMFQLGDEEHAFLFVPHHLIWDGWSFDVLQQEISTIYGAMLAGRRHDLPAPGCSQGDYAEWLQAWMQSPACQTQLDAWKARFARAPLPRALSTDLPRRAGMSGQGAAQWIEVNAATTEQLRGIARSMGVTLSMLTFAVFALMLGDVIGTPSVTIANPVRGRELAETEDVLGFFNNVLPVTFEIDPALSFDGFMRHVKQELTALMPLQQLPFERLVAEPEFTRWAQGVGLYQGMFSFQDTRSRPLDIGPLHCSQIHVLPRAATDDLGVWLMDKPQGLEGALVYNADIYLAETGVQLRDRYLELLRRVAAAPGARLSQLVDHAGSLSGAYLTRLRAQAPPSPLAEDIQVRRDPPGAAGLAPTQAALAQIWADVMRIDVASIRAGDNFFDLGGDSLLVMRAVQQAEQKLGLRSEPRRYLFENLGQLAIQGPATARGGAAAASSGSGFSGLRLIGRMFGGWRDRS